MSIALRTRGFNVSRGHCSPPPRAVVLGADLGALAAALAAAAALAIEVVLTAALDALGANLAVAHVAPPIGARASSRWCSTAARTFEPGRGRRGARRRP